MTSLLRVSLLFILAFFTIDSVTAQCPGCTPDLSCTSSPAFPTICPTQTPDATVGEPYLADLTFWMPAIFSDPGSGITVDLTQITVTGVSGLPFGLALETNDPSGVYFPQQNEFGCARLCGTPLGAGIYNITISILATVEVSGFITQVPEQFVLLLTVLPGSGGNNSFIFTPSSGCGAVTATFEALIDADPAPTSYSWDLGSDITSTAQFPPPQTYDTAGAYVISLETTIGGYALNTVTITGVNDNWCGDIEEPNVPFVGCSGSPDLYFVLTDASGTTFQSNTYDDTFSATWTALDLVLSNPPYSIAVYDEDVVSQNDHLGTYNIPANGSGTYFINVAGGTSGSLNISEQTIQTFFDTDTLIVHPLPIVVIEEIGDQLCTNDTSLVSHIWLLDSDTIPGVNGPCIDAFSPGSYEVIAVNGFGCQDISEVFVVCPTIEIELTENVFSVPSGYSNYTWSLNGTVIEGANGSFVLVQGSGNYSVLVDAGEGCMITASYDLIVGINDLAADGHALRVFPNPNNGQFTIEATNLSGSHALIEVIDLSGKTLHWEKTSIVNGDLKVAIVQPLIGGQYILRISDGRSRLHRSITVI